MLFLQSRTGAESRNRGRVVGSLGVNPTTSVTPGNPLFIWGVGLTSVMQGNPLLIGGVGLWSLYGGLGFGMPFLFYRRGFHDPRQRELLRVLQTQDPHGASGVDPIFLKGEGDWELRGGIGAERPKEPLAFNAMARRRGDRLFSFPLIRQHENIFQ